MTTATLKQRPWFFEIYTRNPQDLSVEGWDIEVGFVLHADSYLHAKSKIERRFGKLFDCIIQLHESEFSRPRCKATIIH